MYAVIKTGGKQYRVAEGQTLRVEKLDAQQGASVELAQVLMIANGEQFTLGTPYVDEGRVTAIVKAHGRNPKVEIVKFRRRKHYRKQMGHRQHYTELQIARIAGPGITAAMPETASTMQDTVDPSGVTLDK
jgi:large subunit ribosomal protein L21